MYIKLLVAAAAAAMVFVLFNKKSDIDGAKAKALVEAGAKLVDVRTPAEYEAAHIEGAVNIPLGQVERRVDEFGAKADTIVLYCRSGNRSGKAQAILRARGFGDVHNLGPMSAWP